MLRTLIIDDEILIRQMIRRIIETTCRDVEIVGEAGEFNEAIELIKLTDPDLVLLDIKIPGGSGFDLLYKIKKPDFKIIFVTAYEEFAINAFEFAAIDYLLKPIDQDAIVKAIKKAKFTIQAELSLKLNTLLNNMEAERPEKKKLVLRTSNNIHIVAIESIVHLESDQNYTMFYINDGRKIIVSKTLGAFDDMLSDQGFFRVHKSHLINVKRISRFEKANGGTVVMNNDSRIPVASRKRESLLQLFDNM